MASDLARPLQASPMAALRAERGAAAQRLEDARQGLGQTKAQGLATSAREQEEQQQRLTETLSAKRNILAEVGSVRDRQRVLLSAQRSQTSRDVDAAGRASAAAEGRAANARLDADTWRTSEAQAEALRRATWERNNQHVRLMQGGHEARVAQARTIASDRADHGNGITQEALNGFESIQNRHRDQCRTEEAHAKKVFEIRERCAEENERRRLTEVGVVTAKAARSHAASSAEMKRAHEDVASSVDNATQEYEDRCQQYRAALEGERVCNAKAKSMATQFKEVQESQRLAQRGKLEAELQRVSDLLVQRDTLAQDRVQAAHVRKQAWEGHCQQLVEAAERRAEKEEVQAAEREQRAKAILADLQATCVARINTLMQRWEDVKSKDDAKVKAAQAKFDKVSRFCEAERTRRQDRKEIVLRRTTELADKMESSLSEKVAAFAESSDVRVATAELQASERGKMTQKQLADLRQHVEEVRLRCEERVQIEEDMAREKVAIATKRISSTIAHAEQRSCEAEARRDEVRLAHAALTAKTRGAAEEARRRGLMQVADILEPPAPPRHPSEIDLWAERPDSRGCPGQLTGSTALPPPTSASPPVTIGTVEGGLADVAEAMAPPGDAARVVADAEAGCADGQAGPGDAPPPDGPTDQADVHAGGVQDGGGDTAPPAPQGSAPADSAPAEAHDSSETAGGAAAPTPPAAPPVPPEDVEGDSAAQPVQAPFDSAAADAEAPTPPAAPPVPPEDVEGDSAAQPVQSPLDSAAADAEAPTLPAAPPVPPDDVEGDPEAQLVQAPLDSAAADAEA